MQVGVIGYGYWGPNIARNVCLTEGFELGAICDTSSQALCRAQQMYPGVTLTQSEDDLLRSTVIDVIAIVTPVGTHYDLAKKALSNGKHVFVEKPFTANASQAEELVNLAERNHLLIMVDHTFLFTPAVKKIHELISDGVLGDLYYYDSLRVNLGLFQHDINVIWDLAPHDLSIMDYLTQAHPEAVVATGQKHLNGYEDVAFITLYFPNRMIAHVNVNWLSPVKVRTTLIGGTKKMVVWDDLASDEKIRVYDKGVYINDFDGVHQLRVSYRSGDMWAPRLEQAEALRAEFEYFRSCIVNNARPFNDGIAGWRVVGMLEGVDASLKSMGELVMLNNLPGNRAPEKFMAARAGAA